MTQSALFGTSKYMEGRPYAVFEGASLVETLPSMTWIFVRLGRLVLAKYTLKCIEGCLITVMKGAFWGKTLPKEPLAPKGGHVPMFTGNTPPVATPLPKNYQTNGRSGTRKTTQWKAINETHPTSSENCRQPSSWWRSIWPHLWFFVNNSEPKKTNVTKLGIAFHWPLLHLLQKKCRGHIRTGHQVRSRDMTSKKV